MKLSKISQAQCEAWRDFFNKESQHCEQKYLTADTHGIVKNLLRSSHVAIITATVEMLHEMGKTNMYEEYTISEVIAKLEKELEEMKV